MPDKPTGGMAARIGEIADHCSGIGGAALIVYGTSQIYPPAGIIAAGAFLLAAAWMPARKADI